MKCPDCNGVGSCYSEAAVVPCEAHRPDDKEDWEDSWYWSDVPIFKPIMEG